MKSKWRKRELLTNSGSSLSLSDTQVVFSSSPKIHTTSAFSIVKEGEKDEKGKKDDDYHVDIEREEKRRRIVTSADKMQVL